MTLNYSETKLCLIATYMHHLKFSKFSSHLGYLYRSGLLETWMIVSK